MWKIGRSVLIAVAALILSHQAVGGSIRTVVHSAQTSLSVPMIDAHGRTAFSLPPLRIEAPSEASLSAVASADMTPDPTIAGSYFERQLGLPELIFAGPREAPGVPAAVTYRGLSGTINLGEEGDIAFKAILQGSGISSANDEAAFVIDKHGVSRMVFQENQQLISPGTGGVIASFRFISSDVPQVDSLGHVTMPVSSNHQVANTRIMQEGVNGAALLSNLVPIETYSRQGPVVVNFNATSISQINSSRNGHVVFRAQLQSPNFSSANSIVAASPIGELRAVARIGEDFSDGRFSQFFAPSINRQGDVAFVANWSDTSNRRGILRETGGALEIAVQVGDMIAQVGPEVVIASLQDVIHYNDRGDVAFAAHLAGPSITSSNNFALYVDSPVTGLSQVARRGDQAPGTELGVRFNTPASGDLVLNNAGQTAFYASLYGSGHGNDAGIWASDRDGTMHIIVRVGDLLNVSRPGEPDDFRSVARLWMNAGRGNATAVGSGFNDNGQIAFTARFTDGTYGIFVSNAVAIPEPATVAILLLGIAAAIGLSKPSHRT